MGSGEEVLGSFTAPTSSRSSGREGERELLWVFDDLHCPNPVSPMFFDIGGWWLTCDHMFRRFGTPFASDWVAKEINGYVYTAAIPADPSLRAEATEYQARYVAARAARRRLRRRRSAPTSASCCRTTPRNFLDWWRERLRPEIERNFAYLDGYDMDGGEPRRARRSARGRDRRPRPPLEDPLDAQLRPVLGHDGAERDDRRGRRATSIRACPARLQSSVDDRNWDSIEALWQMKEEVKGDAELHGGIPRRRHRGRRPARRSSGSERGRRFVEERLRPYQLEFGNKAIWSHEFVYPTWRENPAPIVEAVRGYLETDYDFAADARGGQGRSRGGRSTS